MGVILSSDVHAFNWVSTVLLQVLGPTQILLNNLANICKGMELT